MCIVDLMGCVSWKVGVCGFDGELGGGGDLEGESSLRSRGGDSGLLQRRTSSVMPLTRM